MGLLRIPALFVCVVLLLTAAEGQPASRLRKRPRACFTELGCARDSCCMRSIMDGSGAEPPLFSKVGKCTRATDIQDSNRFVITRIDSDLREAANLELTLTKLVEAQEFLGVCRHGTLSTSTTLSDGQPVRRRRQTRNNNIPLSTVIDVVSSPEVFVAVEAGLEAPVESVRSPSSTSSRENADDDPLDQFDDIEEFSSELKLHAGHDNAEKLETDNEDNFHQEEEAQGGMDRGLKDAVNAVERLGDTQNIHDFNSDDVDLALELDGIVPVDKQVLEAAAEYDRGAGDDAGLDKNMKKAAQTSGVADTSQEHSDGYQASRESLVGQEDEHWALTSADTFSNGEQHVMEGDGQHAMEGDAYLASSKDYAGDSNNDAGHMIDAQEVLGLMAGENQEDFQERLDEDVDLSTQEETKTDTDGAANRDKASRDKASREGVNEEDSSPDSGDDGLTNLYYDQEPVDTGTGTEGGAGRDTSSSQSRSSSSDGSQVTEQDDMDSDLDGSDAQQPAQDNDDDGHADDSKSQSLTQDKREALQALREQVKTAKSMLTKLVGDLEAIA